MFTYNMVDLIPFTQPQHETQNSVGGVKSYQNELNFDRLQTPFTPAARFNSPFVDAALTPLGYHNSLPDTDASSISITMALQSLDYRENVGGMGGSNAQTVWGGIDWGVVL